MTVFFNKVNIKFIARVFGVLIVSTSFNLSYAEDDSWLMSGILQSYIQTYDGSTSRKGSFNAGAYLNADYLDSGGIGFGYNYNIVDFENNAELTEHLFYLSGRYHLYLDALPGKLTLRLDGYFGEDTIKYNVNNPPGITGGGGTGGGGAGGGGAGGGGAGGGGTGGGGMGSSNTIAVITNSASSTNITETTDITAYHPQLAFLNYAKTFYADIGYAYTKYDGTSMTEVNQLTPTVGFGWNESFDWLQLRGYLIKIDESVPVHSDDQFESVEIKYTHWFADSTSLDYLRLTALLGKRLLAVDPDAGTIYSTADKQTGSIAAGMQWKLAQATKMLTLINYGQHHNESLNNDYDSLLFYLNLQFQW